MSSHQSLSLRSLRRALDLLGGPEELAAELQLSASDLKRKLDGLSHIPEVVFFRVVDLLLDMAPLAERGKARARSLLRWLPSDAFERLTAEQKETYVLKLTKQLGLYP